MKRLLSLFLLIGSSSVFGQTYDEFEKRVLDLLNSQKIDLADSYLDSVLTVEPDCVHCYWYKATISYNQGNSKAALTFLDKLFTFDLPHYKPDAYLLLGEILEHNQQFKQAIDAYDQALKIAPESGFIMARKGWVLYQHINDPEGTLLIEKGYALTPGNAFCRFTHLHVLFSEGNYELYTQQAGPLLADPQYEPYVTSLLAQAHMYVKNYDSAIYYYEKSKAFDTSGSDEADEMIKLIREQKAYESTQKSTQSKNKASKEKKKPADRKLEDYTLKEKELKVLDMYFTPLRHPGSGQADRFLLTLSVSYKIKTYASAYRLSLANGTTLDFNNANLTDRVRLKYHDTGFLITGGTSNIQFVVEEKTLELIRNSGIADLISFWDYENTATVHQLEVPTGLAWNPRQ